MTDFSLGYFCLKTMVEDDLQWKMIFGGGWPSVVDGLQWETTFSGRRPYMEDNLRWKMTFGGRQPSMEGPLVENDLWWIFACCLVHFAAFYKYVFCVRAMWYDL